MQQDLTDMGVPSHMNFTGVAFQMEFIEIWIGKLHITFFSETLDSSIRMKLDWPMLKHYTPHKSEWMIKFFKPFRTSI